MNLRFERLVFRGSILFALALVLSYCVPAESQSVPSQTAKLLPSDGAADDWFGYSVAISENTAIVGAIWDDDNGESSGAVYLFDPATGGQITKFLASDTAAGDAFGFAVAIDGNTAIVGAYNDDDYGQDSGSAYVFDVTTGQQIAKLLPDDGAAGDVFGWSVGISGTTAIVGAHRDDDNGDSSGSAYLFDVTTGMQIAKIVPIDNAAFDCFGGSVGISGTTAIIGAQRDNDNGDQAGSAYLFDTTTGQQIAKLLADDGADFDWFGGSVGINGTTAIVGAKLHADNGAAYLFNTTTGQQIAKLLANDGARNDHFGQAVGITGTSAIVTAYQDDDNGDQSGSAYTFDITTGQQLAKLLPVDGATGDSFGRSVGINGTKIIVGAYLDDDNGNDSGSAYVFEAGPEPTLPDSFKLADGVHVGGQFSDVFLSDDQYFELDPSPTKNLLKQKIHLIMQSTSPTNVPTAFQFRFESSMTGGPSGDVVQTIELFNYNTNQLELLDVRPVANTDESIDLVPSGDLSRFINPITNEISAEITWKSESFTGPMFSWSIDVDEAVWSISE